MRNAILTFTLAGVLFLSAVLPALAQDADPLAVLKSDADLKAKQDACITLSIHGGPYGQYGVGFFDEFQVYTAAGYAVAVTVGGLNAGRSTSMKSRVRVPAALAVMHWAWGLGFLFGRPTPPPDTTA